MPLVRQPNGHIHPSPGSIAPHAGHLQTDAAGMDLPCIDAQDDLVLVHWGMGYRHSSARRLGCEGGGLTGERMKPVHAACN